MDQQFIEKAEDYPNLGPHYFAAQEAAKRIAEVVEGQHFEPLIKKFTGELYEKLLEATEEYLKSNVEDNAQGEIWRGVDDSVQDLLSGKGWALKRYALGERYDAEAVRAAIAKHIPEELLSQRLKDLEKENAELRKELDYQRRAR